jgi:hypothetical protein
LRWPAGARRASFRYTVIGIGFLTAVGSGAALGEPDARTGLGLPVDCMLAQDCFVQQMPDIRHPKPAAIRWTDFFEPSARQMLSRLPTTMLDVGLARAPPELPNLVREGGPPLVELSEPIVAWVWAINVEQGSLFRIQLVGPDRNPIMDLRTNALEGRKANYLVYVAAKYGAIEGVYDLRIALLAGTRTIQSTTRSFNIAR